MKKTRRNFLVRGGVIAGFLSVTGTATAESIRIWDTEKVYRDGDYVTYNNYVWEAHWYTKGQEPADSAAVWNRIRAHGETDGYPRWTPEGIYRDGNRVVYEDAVWEAQWWTENQAPSTDPWGPWDYIKDIEQTDGSDSTDTTDEEPEDGNTMTTPVDQYGQLQVLGTDLCDETGSPVQLAGMSTHGLQWHGWGDSITTNSLDVLATDWESELCRIAMYVQEEGYETDPTGFTTEVNRIIEELTDRGLYALVDFHTLDPGNPMDTIENAQRFFDDIAAEHAEKDNIIFEICNEPNGVDWETIKTYAEEVSPVIRQHDPDSPIVVGTRGWSSLGFADIGSDGPQEIVDNPVDGENILYAYHFYAASHGQWERDQLDAAADELPIFVTECGSMEYDGDGPSDFDSTQSFMDVMADNNISWAFWNYSDDWRTSGVWKEGTAEDGTWTAENLTETGDWIRTQIKDN